MKSTRREFLAEQVLIVGGPPISLTRFIEQMGINPITAWRWRKAGMLKTINLCGRQYVRSEDVAAFNRRAAAGEFAKEHITPMNRENKTRTQRK